MKGKYKNKKAARVMVERGYGPRHALNAQEGEEAVPVMMRKPIEGIDAANEEAAQAHEELMQELEDRLRDRGVPPVRALAEPDTDGEQLPDRGKLRAFERYMVQGGASEVPPGPMTPAELEDVVKTIQAGVPSYPQQYALAPPEQLGVMERIARGAKETLGDLESISTPSLLKKLLQDKEPEGYARGTVAVARGYGPLHMENAAEGDEVVGQRNRVLQPGSYSSPVIQMIKENEGDPDIARLMKKLLKADPEFTAQGGAERVPTGLSEAQNAPLVIPQYAQSTAPDEMTPEEQRALLGALKAGGIRYAKSDESNMSPEHEAQEEIAADDLGERLATIRGTPELNKDEIQEVLHVDPRQWSDSVREKIGAANEEAGREPQNWGGGVELARGTIGVAKGFGPLHAENSQEGMETANARAGSTDTVPAMLTPREAVLNRNAAELAGRSNIKKLNARGNKLAAEGVDLAAKGQSTVPLPKDVTPDVMKFLPLLDIKRQEKITLPKTSGVKGYATGEENMKKQKAKKYQGGTSNTGYPNNAGMGFGLQPGNPMIQTKPVQGVWEPGWGPGGYNAGTPPPATNLGGGSPYPFGAGSGVTPAGPPQKLQPYGGMQSNDPYAGTNNPFPGRGLGGVYPKVSGGPGMLPVVGGGGSPYPFGAGGGSTPATLPTRPPDFANAPLQFNQSGPFQGRDQYGRYPGGGAPGTRQNPIGLQMGSPAVPPAGPAAPNFGRMLFQSLLGRGGKRPPMAKRRMPQAVPPTVPGFQGGTEETPSSAPIGYVSPQQREQMWAQIQLSAPSLNVAALKKSGVDPQTLMMLGRAIGGAYGGGGMTSYGEGSSVSQALGPALEAASAGGYQGGISDIGYPPMIGPNMQYHGDRGGWIGGLDPMYMTPSYQRGTSNVGAFGGPFGPFGVGTGGTGGAQRYQTGTDFTRMLDAEGNPSGWSEPGILHGNDPNAPENFIGPPTDTGGGGNPPGDSGTPSGTEPDPGPPNFGPGSGQPTQKVAGVAGNLLGGVAGNLAFPGLGGLLGSKLGGMGARAFTSWLQGHPGMLGNLGDLFPKDTGQLGDPLSYPGWAQNIYGQQGVGGPTMPAGGGTYFGGPGTLAIPGTTNIPMYGGGGGSLGNEFGAYAGFHSPAFQAYMDANPQINQHAMLDFLTGKAGRPGAPVVGADTGFGVGGFHQGQHFASR